MKADGPLFVSMFTGKTRDEIAADRMLQLALTRLVEIVGEGAARVTPKERLSYPQIPWPAMTGMGNRLIHGYDTIDVAALQSTVSVDLPTLIDHVQTVSRGR